MNTYELLKIAAAKKSKPKLGWWEFQKKAIGPRFAKSFLPNLVGTSAGATLGGLGGLLLAAKGHRAPVAGLGAGLGGAAGSFAATPWVTKGVRAGDMEAVRRLSKKYPELKTMKTPKMWKYYLGFDIGGPGYAAAKKHIKKMRSKQG